VRNFRSRALLVTILLSSGPVVRATETADIPQPADHPQVRGAIALIDRWLDGYQAYRRVPGMSVGIVIDQDLVFSRGYGFANVRRGRPATAETIYSICSISKLFTAIGVMQQRDAGNLALSDRVSDHLDWFDIRNAHPDGGPITVESLLTHSSGLPRESDFPYWSGPDYAFPDRAAMIDRLAAQETLYPAGTFFQYSNLALTLAGEIVAARSGMSYEDYVEEKILRPLGLEQTLPRFRHEAYGKAMAVGYSALDRSGNRAVVPEFDTRAITPAAGFTSNVVDLARFASWQFRVLDGADDGVLRPSTLREMQRVHWTDPNWKLTWGLGFVVSNEDGQTLVGHGGSCPGYRTILILHPKSKLGAIVMMNATGTDPDGVAEVILKTMAPALAEAKKPSTEAIPDLSAYEGVYDAQPWASERIIVQQGARLLVTSLPSYDDPLLGIQKLKREDGHRFRRVRDDSDIPGEVWQFLVDDAGTVTGVTVHSNTSPKIR